MLIDKGCHKIVAAFILFIAQAKAFANLEQENLME